MEMKILGYRNDRTADIVIAETIKQCIAQGHDPEDIDPRRIYGHHTVQCQLCGYRYYEDSGD